MRILLSMRWFVSKENCISEFVYKLSVEDFHYLSRVRRLKKGERLELVVDSALVRVCEVVALEDGLLSVTLVEELPAVSSVSAEITLIQGLPKQDKMSDILNGCTQLGVSTFYPVEMSRSIVAYSDKQKQKKLERWKEVVHAASLQSYQIKQPEVKPVTTWNSFLSEFDGSKYDSLLVAWEDETGATLKSILSSVKKKCPKIAIVIGPEGGLTQDEVEALKRKGFVSISLGSTILRTEVAGLVGCSQIIFHFL